MSGFQEGVYAIRKSTGKLCIHTSELSVSDDDTLSLLFTVDAFGEIWPKAITPNPETLECYDLLYQSIGMMQAIMSYSELQWAKIHSSAFDGYHQLLDLLEAYLIQVCELQTFQTVAFRHDFTNVIDCLYEGSIEDVNIYKPVNPQDNYNVVGTYILDNSKAKFLFKVPKLHSNATKWEVRDLISRVGMFTQTHMGDYSSNRHHQVRNYILALLADTIRDFGKRVYKNAPSLSDKCWMPSSTVSAHPDTSTGFILL